MGNTLVIGREALALLAVATTKGTRDTGGLLEQELVVFVDDEGLGVKDFVGDGRPMTITGEEPWDVALALLARALVVKIGVVAFGVVIGVVLCEFDVVTAVELEVFILRLLRLVRS